jgi:sec-independent protein translocase protein TatB
MFDIGWGELLIIGGVALVVIKPKDLPGVLRTVGQTVGKIRRMAGEFQGQFQEALREANLDEARKTISGLNDSVSSSLDSSFNPIQTIRDEIKNATEGKAAGDAGGSTLVGSPETPPIDLALPEPPPVPDLTPEQIQAAFSTEPLGAALPAAEEPAPEKPKRSRKKKVESPVEEPVAQEPVAKEPVALAAPAQPPAAPNYFEDMPAEPSAAAEAAPAEAKTQKPRAPRKAAVKAKTKPASETDSGDGDGAA